jgi:type II secretory pathway component PulC
MSAPQNRGPRDPAIILRRNIFNSELGDLTQVPVAEDELVDVESILDGEQELTSCNGKMRLIGTAVIPDDFERSMAMIVGSSGKNAFHQGGAEVDGSRVRAIYSHGVVLQTASGGLCELAMFEQGRPRPKEPRFAPPNKPARRGVPTPEEIEDGIKIIDPSLVHIKRVLLNRIITHFVKLRASVSIGPKVERLKPPGLRIRRVRSNNVVHKLGIRSGDIIESIDGKPVLGADAARDGPTLLRTADKFTLTVRRDGKTFDIRYNID